MKADRGLVGAAAGVAALVFLLLVPRLEDVGLTWDEPWYFDSANRIQDWTAQVVAGPDRLGALRRDGIHEVWAWAKYYNPHPPAYKVAMAATEAVAGPQLGSVTGFRMASALWFSLLVAGVGLLAARRWGWAAGAAAALALLSMPRVVGHAHVAATDMPLTLFWFCGSVGLAAFLRRGGSGTAVLGAAGLGLGMATKFTGYLLFIPLLAWALLDRIARRRLPWILLPIVGAVALAYLVNPLAWHDPVGYLTGLFQESLGREETVPIATYYFGTQHPFSAPWHHPPVMTAATIPLALLVLAAWGVLRGAKTWGEGWLGALCLVQVMFFWFLLGLPTSPTHDGVRLFLPAFPFIALLAGRGFGEILKIALFRFPGRKSLTAAILTVIFLLLPLGQILQARPYYLSYYSEWLGGARGAAVWGLEQTYWYDAVTPSFLEEVNDLLPEGASLATFPSHYYFQYLQTKGRLRGDIEIRERLPADFLLLSARKATFGSVEWGLYREVTPVRAVTYHGVELVGLYSWRGWVE